MYVKIIKCSDDTLWYRCSINGIFEVEEKTKKLFETINPKRLIFKQDCEIIDFNPDQISEKKAREMLISTNTLEEDEINEYIDIWKKEGYIKQNRKDEIKKELNYKKNL